MTEKRTRADIIDMHKARVEACFEDYRLAVLAYAEWMAAWRERQRVARETEQGRQADARLCTRD